MKKTPIFVGMALGAIVGLLTSIPDGLGLKIVMMSIGAVAGTAMGGVFSRPREKRGMPWHEDDESLMQGTSARDRMRNFWRDKGKTIRLSEPLDLNGTRHDFDQGY